MEIPTEITFHDLPQSDGVEASIQRWVARLEHVAERISFCRVFVMQPHRRHRTGKDFEVHVHLAIPGDEIAASHIHSEDIYIAVADAFRAARRQLLDRRSVRRSHTRPSQLSA
jgi:ribosome-associated translation inhibitor RaiA